MKKFNIVVEEILRRVVTEETESLLDAIDIVESKYDNQDIVLDYEDLVNTEIRESGEFSKEETFYTCYGKSVLLEGDEKLALIRTMNRYEEDYNYVVAKNMTYDSKVDMFNWKAEKHFKNILNAIEYFDEQQENKIEKDYLKNNKDLPTSRKVEIYDMLLNDIFEGNNYTEAVRQIYGYGLTVEELSTITSCKPEEIKNMLEDESEQELE